MGKKGGTRHLKRKPAPEFWPIHRKEYVWAFKSTPGPHALDQSLPLAMVVRDILGFAKTRGEAKNIISQEKILIDGQARKELAFPVGLMDVVAIPDAEVYYRVLSHEKGFTLHPITKDESAFKLCRIENKTVTAHGHVQLNLHDGTNRLIRVADAGNPHEDLYETLNVLKVAIPSGEIVGQIKLAKNAPALIVGGQNRGTHGKIVEIEAVSGKKRHSLLTTVENPAGRRVQTILGFIFVVGDGAESISLPEVK